MNRNSPVLLTENFTLTVRRMKETLEGRDVWLLVADSEGINVWCAAGGGHLTHHDVISVIRTSRIRDRVDNAEIVLPQLCATGVERHKVEEATGFSSKWGPARMEDLPAYLDRGQRTRRAERFARFPIWERLEMAAVWTIWIEVFTLAVVWLIGGVRPAIAVGVAIAVAVGGIFLAVDRLPMMGGRRWLTFTGFALAATVLGWALLATISTASALNLGLMAAACAIALAVLSVDINGTTPIFPSSVNTHNNNANVELVDERCMGAADCVLVCPRDVLEMNGSARKVEIRRPEACIQCGACVVQCPEDALRFRYADGRIVEPATIRSTRMNMLGRRTVVVQASAAEG